MTPHIIMCGDPKNGFTFFGPFNGVDAAVRWAEDNIVDVDDWWPVRLYSGHLNERIERRLQGNSSSWHPRFKHCGTLANRIDDSE
jgi:hypothetical protein